jgi:hypothetical protein
MKVHYKIEKATKMSQHYRYRLLYHYTDVNGEYYEDWMHLDDPILPEEEVREVIRFRNPKLKYTPLHFVEEP